MCRSLWFIWCHLVLHLGWLTPPPPLPPLQSNSSSELQEMMRRRQEKINMAASDSGVESFDEGSGHWGGPPTSLTPPTCLLHFPGGRWPIPWVCWHHQTLPREPGGMRAVWKDTAPADQWNAALCLKLSSMMFLWTDMTSEAGRVLRHVNEAAGFVT